MSIFIVVIILLICILLYLWRRPKSARELYQQSNGTLDNAARQAFAVASNRPRDAFVRAEIIQYNILGGDQEFDTPVEQNLRIELRGFIDAALNNLVFDDDPYNMRIITQGMHFNPTAAHEVNRQFQQVRKENIKQIASNKKEEMTLYLGDSKQVVHDPQNVHDSHVNKDLSDKMEIIKINSDIESELAEFLAYVEGLKDTTKRERVLETYGIMKEMNKYISAIGAHELTVLASVWHRMKQNPPENADNIRDALIEEMADASANEGTVCANGRVGRIIDSLTLFDSNPKLSGELRSVAVIRNEVFGQAQEIITTFIAQQKNSHDDSMKAVANSYDDPDSYVPNAAAEDKFRTQLIELLDKNVDAAAKKYDLSPIDTDYIKTECRAAVV